MKAAGVGINLQYTHQWLQLPYHTFTAPHTQPLPHTELPLASNTGIVPPPWLANLI